MQVGQKYTRKRRFQIGLFSVLCVLATTVSALGLGEIKVSSNLGERLKAQVELLDMEREDPQDVKIKLASLQEYKKMNFFIRLD